MNCFSSLAHNERVYDVLSTSKTILENGKPVLDMIPVPGLATAVEVLIGIIGKVEEVRTTQKGLEELSNEIQGLVDAIERTRKTMEDRLEQYGTNGRQALQDRSRGSVTENLVNELCSRLDRLKMQADGLYNGPCFLRCFHSSRDAETLGELQSGINSAFRYFTSQCEVAILGQIDEVLRNLAEVSIQITEGFQNINRAHKTEKDEKVLEALPHVEASYRAYHNGPKSGFLEGTRSKLLEELEAWAEGRTLASDSGLSSHPICILTGDVGTGKSTIAFEFAKRLEKQYKSYGASFFFDQGMEDLSSPKFFFTTIAYELVQFQGAFRQPIIDAARGYLKGGKCQVIENGGKYLIEQAIEGVGSGHPAVLLVVDAVDECNELVTNLLATLLRCVDVRKSLTRTQLRVFITSRPDDSASHKFLSNHSDNVQSISLDDAFDEIPTFLHHRFSQTAPGKRALESRDQLVERIASHAKRSFLVARTFMDTLDSADLDHFDETLRRLLDSIAERAVVQPTLRSRQPTPRDPLDGLYLTILETAFPSGDMTHGNTLHAHVEAVLGCIALLSDHLSPRALEAFMAISPDDSLRVLYKLRAVVLSEDSNTDGLFRPMHASFSLFLVDPDRCTNPLYLVNKPREQARLAEGCLNVVMSLGSNVVQPANTAAGQVEMSEDLAKQAQEHTMLPHVRYACLHWGSHLGEAEKTEGLTKAVDKFAAPETMQKWLVALGDLGRLEVAEAALGSAYEWEEPSNPKRGLLDKARRLVHKIEDHSEAVESFAREIRVDAHNPAVGQPAVRKGSDFDRVIPGGYPRDSVAYSPGRENP